MSYYAKFESHSGEVFRMDTRVYLQETPLRPSDGQCVAAIVGKNPGSAKSAGSNEWKELELDGDKLLPTVRNIFRAAYKKAGKQIPHLAFVQVWNLFYLCNKNLKDAIQSITRVKSLPLCPTENNCPNIVWFAWGGDRKLNFFKERFQKKECQQTFFYDKPMGEISPNLPTSLDFAKHTQGLKQQPVIDHLARIL